MAANEITEWTKKIKTKRIAQFEFELARKPRKDKWAEKKSERN